MRSVPKIISCTALIAAGTLLASQAHAAASRWDHNGSIMRFEEDGKKRRFVYQEPRRTLGPAGVREGTVLFEGEEKKDGRLAGYAKLFRKGCDPVDYFVEGAVNKRNGEILLQGQAPIYSGDGCKITGYTDDGSASSLSFTQLDTPDRYVAGDEQTSQQSIDERAQSYLPPNERGRAGANRRDDYGDRRDYRDRRANDDRGYSERDPVYGRYDRRDYAYGSDRFERRRRYDRGYDPYFRDDANEDDYYYEDYDDPAYEPYQPRWRRYRY